MRPPKLKLGHIKQRIPLSPGVAIGDAQAAVDGSKFVVVRAIAIDAQWCVTRSGQIDLRDGVRVVHRPTGMLATMIADSGQPLAEYARALIAARPPKGALVLGSSGYGRQSVRVRAWLDRAAQMLGAVRLPSGHYGAGPEGV